MNTERVDLAGLRRDCSLSQQGLAELAGVSQSTISRIESGDTAPTLPLLKNIAKGLGKPLRALIPEDQLLSMLGQDELETFFAFCPNPFCDRNHFHRKDGKDYVNWGSGKKYPAGSFDEVNFCTRCGTPLLKECPSCGRRLEETGTRYCLSCGEQVYARPTTDEWAKIHEILDKTSCDEEVPF